MSGNTVALPPHGRHRHIDPRAVYFGAAVTLVSTLNFDATPFLRPFSACLTVGRTLVLGFNGVSTTQENLSRAGDCVVNVPQHELAPALQAYARATRSGTAGNGFESMGLTPVSSQDVKAPRARECYLQLEAHLVAMHKSPSADATWAELRIERVHAVSDIVVDDSDRIDATRWRPLVYSFAQFLSVGETGVVGPMTS